VSKVGVGLSTGTAVAIVDIQRGRREVRIDTKGSSVTGREKEESLKRK